MTAAVTTALTAIADSLAAADIVIADSELETLLQRAEAAKPRSRQSLAAYLAELDTPWTTPNPHCPPYVFARVAYLLWQSGYLVQPVPCAQCGRITPKLDRVIEGARCCGWCASRRTEHVCERCGQLATESPRPRQVGFAAAATRKTRPGGNRVVDAADVTSRRHVPLRACHCAATALAPPSMCALVAAASITPRNSPVRDRYASAATRRRRVPAASAAPSAPPSRFGPNAVWWICVSVACRRLTNTALSALISGPCTHGGHWGGRYACPAIDAPLPTHRPAPPVVTPRCSSPQTRQELRSADRARVPRSTTRATVAVTAARSITPACAYVARSHRPPEDSSPSTARSGPNLNSCLPSWPIGGASRPQRCAG